MKMQIIKHKPLICFDFGLSFPLHTYISMFFKKMTNIPAFIIIYSDAGSLILYSNSMQGYLHFSSFVVAFVWY